MAHLYFGCSPIYTTSAYAYLCTKLINKMLNLAPRNDENPKKKPLIIIFISTSSRVHDWHCYSSFIVARIPKLRPHIPVFPSALAIFATYVLIFLCSSSGMHEVQTDFSISERIVMRPFSSFWPHFALCWIQNGHCLFPVPSESNLRHFPATLASVLVGQGSTTYTYDLSKLALWCFERLVLVLTLKSLAQAQLDSYAGFCSVGSSGWSHSRWYLCIRLLKSSWFSKVLASETWGKKCPTCQFQK